MGASSVRASTCGLVVAAVARAGPNDSCAVLADENARFIVRIAMRPMVLDLVESRIVVSAFQFGYAFGDGRSLRLRWRRWTFA